MAQLKVQTLNEADVATNSAVSNEGRLTFTEKKIHFGIGKKYISYGGADADEIKRIVTDRITFQEADAKYLTKDTYRNEIDNKADRSEVYTRDVLDKKLAQVSADKYYNKAEIDSKLLQKLDITTSNTKYYDKTTTDNKLNLKADKTAMDAAVANRLKDFKDLTDTINAQEQVLEGKIQANTDLANEINAKIPAGASDTNQLADKQYVQDLVNQNSSTQLAKDANGSPFDSYNAVVAGPWFNGANQVQPTKNDYVIVTNDINHNGNTVRYAYNGQTWVFSQEFKDVKFTTDQQNAIDSGITTALVTKITETETKLDNEITTSAAERLANKKAISDNKVELETKIGELTALDTTDKTSVVEAINEVNTNLTSNYVNKAGDTMNGALKVDLPGSGVVFEFSTPTKGLTWQLDDTTGYLHLIPKSAPDVGFAFTASTIAPRSETLASSIGSINKPFHKFYTKAINDVEIGNYAIKDDNATQTDDSKVWSAKKTYNTVVKMNFDNIKGEIFNAIYPIGSVYMSFDVNFNPNATFGGTWVKIKAGIFLEATETANQVGVEVAAGLPNITGNFGSAHGLKAGFYANGVFAVIGDRGASVAGNSGNAWEGSVNFDASRSSAVYGRSNTVQPNSIRCYIWIRTA